MTKLNYTPGPWFIDVNTMFDKVFIMCKENLSVNCGFIAEMADTNKNREADTLLIAAAPEMYELLERIHHKLGMMLPMFPPSNANARSELMRDIDDVLRKVGGGKKND